MKNKWILIAGLGLGAALTLSVLSFSSANDASAVDATTTAVTNKKMVMRFGNGEGGFAHGWKPGAMHEGMFMKGGNKMMVRFGGENSAIQTAIKNNDYNAFVTAWNADSNKPSDATVPTQEQFSKMVEMENKRAAVEAAIENNDYNAYVAATTPTKEEFNQIVSQHKSQAAVQAAVEAHDYAAFVEATNDSPMAGKITEEQFNKMIERHEKMTESQAK